MFYFYEGKSRTTPCNLDLRESISLAWKLPKFEKLSNEVNVLVEIPVGPSLSAHTVLCYFRVEKFIGDQERRVFTE